MKDVLASKVDLERRMAALPTLQQQLLGLAREHGRLTIRGAVAALGANRNTVKSHLRQLIDARRLTQHGRGRGTWYESAK